MHMRGRNIFCIYRLVQTSEWAEECGKIWVLYIPEYVRNKWNLVYYSNLQYIVCTNILLSPGRAWNFHQSKLSSQTSWTSNCLTQVWNVIWFVKKKSGGTKSQQWASHKPPEWGIKMWGIFWIVVRWGRNKKIRWTEQGTPVTSSKNPRGAEFKHYFYFYAAGWPLTGVFREPVALHHPDLYTHHYIGLPPIKFRGPRRLGSYWFCAQRLGAPLALFQK